MAGELTEKTRVALSLARLGAMAAMLFGAGWKGNAWYTDIAIRQAAIDAKLVNVVTKADLDALQDRVLKATQSRLKKVAVRCPTFTVRGLQTVVCDLIWTAEE